MAGNRVLFISINHRDMHVLNRAQLINDAYYYMMRGHIASSTFWEIIKYLNKEINYIAWYSMVNILSYVGTY